MKVVILANGNLPPIRYVLRCAVERAGCPVFCISQTDHGIGTHVAIEKHDQQAIAWRKLATELDGGEPSFRIVSISRWFPIRSFVDSLGEKDPIFASDWDILITRNVYESFDHLKLADMACVSGQASYGIFNLDALRAFTDWLYAMYEKKDDWAREKPRSDMDLWIRFRATHPQFKSDAMDRVHNNATFDANLYIRHGWEREYQDLDREFYAIDPDHYQDFNGTRLFAKKIEVIRGDPYFVCAKDPERKIRANSIHCWHSSRKLADIPRIAKALGIE